MDAGCNCGVPVVSKSQRIIEAIKANPGRSSVFIAQQAGVNESSVHDARKKSPSGHPEGEKVTGKDGKSYPASRPTIDSPLKGELWDDYRSRASFRFPQCVSLRSGLNTRSTCRFNGPQDR